MTSSLHASCVEIDGRGVLITGDSGAGKSDLALRLIHEGAKLVADDRVVLRALDNNIFALPAPSLEGMLEIRGVGIIRFPYLPKSRLALAVCLVPREEMQRLPQPAIFEYDGIQVPKLSLYAFDISVAAKIPLVLTVMTRGSSVEGAFGSG